MLEHTFPTQRRRRVLADWSDWVCLAGTAPLHRREWIHVSCRERDDARPPVALRTDGGHHRVHRPGSGGRVSRAELLSGHEDDVRRLGKLGDRVTVEQVTANRLETGIT